MTIERDPAIDHFIQLANSAPRLTRDEETALMRRWFDESCERAREELIRSHLRYVVSIAFKYRRYGLPLADLIAEGSFGLSYALGKFDPTLGNRFVTYAAHWIRAYVLGYVLKHWSLVSVGVRSKHFFRLRRERQRIEGLLGPGEEAQEMLSRETGIARPRLDEILRRLDHRDLSLDHRATPDEGGATLMDRLVGEEQPQDEVMAQRQYSACAERLVREAMHSLDARERMLIESRMLNDEARTLADLGRELGISRERARQLEARGKEKLRVRIAELARQNRDCSDVVTAA